jgi:tRNA(His) 5'-end guanylyltransferase
MSKSKADSLGDRMKRHENVYRFLLPKRTYTILRVGRAFHTWTKGLAKPYDKQFMDCMNAAARALCEQISGAQFAYIQSDEISLLAVDFLDIKTEPWFDGVIQKWVSVGASIATTAFNLQVGYYQKLALRDSFGEGWLVTSARDTSLLGGKKLMNAMFDARVFTIPDLVEVENYYVWRQQDAERNSVTMLAQAYASHKQLHGKNRAAQHEIIQAAGDNWAKHPASFKHGRIIRKIDSVTIGNTNWVIDENTPVFTRNRNYLRDLIPYAWENDILVRKAATSE